MGSLLHLSFVNNCALSREPGVTTVAEGLGTGVASIRAVDQFDLTQGGHSGAKKARLQDRKSHAKTQR